MKKTNSEIFELVSTYHKNLNDSDFVLKRIYFHDFFELKEILISDILLDEWYSDDVKVDDYIHLIKDSKTEMPIPIVTKNFSIIDGTHRLKALDRLGIKKVSVYFGIKLVK